MFDVFYAHPGLLFVVATLLPIASFVILLLAGGLRFFLRSQIAVSRPTSGHGHVEVLTSDRSRPESGSTGGALTAIYNLLGGEVTGRGPALVALGAIVLAFVFSLIGFVTYLQEHEKNAGELA